MHTYIDDLVDDDTQLANFLAWLPPTTGSPATLEQVLASVTPAREFDGRNPFAVHEPEPNHDSFGVTWSSSSPRVTAAANRAMYSLLRAWKALPSAQLEVLPSHGFWFHQSGHGAPTGHQFWEWLGRQSELAYFVVEAIVAWLPGRVAELLDAGWHDDLPW